MHKVPLRSCTALILLVVGPVLPMARATVLTQGERPPLSDEEWDRQLEELERQNKELDDATERALRSLEVSALQLGSSEPWPPVDPEHADPEGFRAAVLAAPRLPAAALLERAPEVSVDLSWSTNVSELLDERELLLELVGAVREAGRATSPKAIPRLDVKLWLDPVRFDFGDMGRGVESFYVVTCEALFVLPARVLRGERVHHTRVQAGMALQQTLRPGAPERTVVAEVLRAAIAQLFASMAAETEATVRAAGEPDVWSLWLADAALAGERQAAFTAAFRDEPQLAPGFQDLPGLRWTGARYHGAERQDETRSLSGDELAASWRGLLAERRVPVDLPAGPDLLHDVILVFGPGSNFAYDVGLTSRVALRDRDCLAVLGGGLVRIDGETYSDSEILYSVETAVVHVLERALKQSREDFFAALGPRPMPPHPDGPAVAAFLRTCERLPVPEDTLAALSDRIARTLAEAPGIPAGLRAEWILENDGQRIYYLPYVGGARSGSRIPGSVQRAVEQAIDELERSDPLAFWAFEHPFSSARNYPVALPEGYADYFTRVRPSGPGALRQVQVLEAREYARRRILYLDDAAKEGAWAKLSELEATLKSARVLACDYIPPDGDMNLTYQRAFWYGLVPPSWDVLRGSLPDEFPLKSVGDPRRVAPDTLAEADAALAAER